MAANASYGVGLNEKKKAYRHKKILDFLFQFSISYVSIERPPG